MQARMLAEDQDAPGGEMASPHGGTQPEDIARRLQAAWEQVRGEGKLPLRRDMDPFANVDLLPYMAILQVHPDPLDFTYRLTGTELDRHMGSVLKGRLISSVPYQKAPSALWDLLSETVRTREPVTRDVPFIGSPSDLREIKIIALPYSLEGSLVDQIVLGLRFISSGLV